MVHNRLSPSSSSEAPGGVGDSFGLLTSDMVMTIPSTSLSSTSQSRSNLTWTDENLATKHLSPIRASTVNRITSLVDNKHPAIVTDNNTGKGKELVTTTEISEQSEINKVMPH